MIFIGFVFLLLIGIAIGYSIGYKNYRDHVLNKLKKNFSDYEMIKIMYHINN